MRIGKPLEHAQAAVKTFTISDPILKYTALGRQLGYAGYLVNDMLIWVRLLLLSPSFLYLLVFVSPQFRSLPFLPPTNLNLTRIDSHR